MSQISSFETFCRNYFVVTEFWEENDGLKQFSTNFSIWSKILKYIRFFSLMGPKCMVTKKKLSPILSRNFDPHILPPKHFDSIRTKSKPLKREAFVVWLHEQIMFPLTKIVTSCGPSFIRFQNSKQKRFSKTAFVWKMSNILLKCNWRWMTAFFDKMNTFNEARFFCAGTLSIDLSKNGSRSTTFVASSSNIRCALNSIFTNIRQKFGNF